MHPAVKQRQEGAHGRVKVCGRVTSLCAGSVGLRVSERNLAKFNLAVVSANFKSLNFWPEESNSREPLKN